MAKSKRNSKRAERRKPESKWDKVHHRFDTLKREFIFLKTQQKRSDEVTLKFISCMQILKDKGLITDAEITAQLNRNQEGAIASYVQPEEAGTDETDDGSEGPEVLALPVSGSDPDDSEPRP